MNDKFVIPMEDRSVDSDAAGELLGYTGRHVRESLAALPGFPKRCDNDGHPRWIYGELKAWRESNQASRQVRRRSSGSKSVKTASHGAR